MRSNKTLKAFLLAAALAWPASAYAAPVKISGLPAASAVGATDVFPVTQGTCPGSCATNGATGTQVKTWAQGALATTTGALKSNGSGTYSQAGAADLSNGVTGSGAVALATSPSLVTPQLGVATAVTLGGKNAVSSITAGATAQIGTGGTVACATSHQCTSISGEVTLTTGTGALSAGLLYTLNFADTRTNIPSCVVSMLHVASTSALNGAYGNETTSTLAVSNGISLTASTTYTQDYVCFGT